MRGLLVGFDSTGFHSCRCFSGVKSDAPPNMKGVRCYQDPSLVDQFCEEDTVFRGIDNDGNIICKEAIDGELLVTVHQGNKCDPDEYVNGILSHCTFRCFVPNEKGMTHEKDKPDSPYGWKTCGCLDFGNTECTNTNFYRKVLTTGDEVEDRRSDRMQKFVKYTTRRAASNPP